MRILKKLKSLTGRETVRLEKYTHKEVVHNPKSAEIIVPVIMNLFHPDSVLDVGCGNGSWLKVFRDVGAKIDGIDGDYVDVDKLLIEREFFTQLDLEKGFDLGRRYDFALSLEVGEHLSHTAAPRFIESLTQASDVILFSAAIPNQGGQNHLNEQEPAYWVKLFNENGFTCYDYFRPRIWSDSRIDYWYRQNVFLAVKTNSSKAKMLESEGAGMPNQVPYLIHPELYNYRVAIIKGIREKYKLKKSDPFDNLMPQSMKF